MTQKPLSCHLKKNLLHMLLDRAKKNKIQVSELTNNTKPLLFITHCALNVRINSGGPSVSGGSILYFLLTLPTRSAKDPTTMRVMPRMKQMLQIACNNYAKLQLLKSTIFSRQNYHGK